MYVNYLFLFLNICWAWLWNDIII